jgi:phosphatidylserine/phosphatidylglycerophosphate/cardiolipin synthase-like enzyme
MPRDSWESNNTTANNPAVAIAIILVVIAFAAGYFLGHHGGVGGILPSSAVATGETTVHFSPKGGCADTVVSELSGATKSVKVMAYSFTSKEIADALIAAQRRGAKVTIICDEKELNEYSRAGECAKAGITVYVDGQHPIAHNKVMLIDGRTIITGSFNFTEQAEHANAENLLVLHDSPLYQQYDDNFQVHLGHSQPFNDSFVKPDRRSKSRSERE